MTVREFHNCSMFQCCPDARALITDTKVFYVHEYLAETTELLLCIPTGIRVKCIIHRSERTAGAVYKTIE